MPFCNEYAGEEKSSDGVGRAGASLVKLKFQPDPTINLRRTGGRPDRDAGLRAGGRCPRTARQR